MDLTGDIHTSLATPTSTSSPRVDDLHGTLAPTGDLTDDVYVTAYTRFGTPSPSILRVRTNGSYVHIAGKFFGPPEDGVEATEGRLEIGPIAILPGGDLLIAESGTDRIRRVTPGGLVTTVVGTRNMPGDAGDDGLATSGLIENPVGVTAWGPASFAFVDAANDTIRAVW